MGVKTIFKVLFTTMVTMVLSMLLIELFNVSIVSYQLRQICRMSARQACILFTSETYKGSSDVGGNISIQNVYTNDGTLWISGDFYACGSPSQSDYAEKVWRKIYESPDFQHFCQNTPQLNKYYSFKILQMAADGSYSPVPTVTWSSSAAQIEEAVKKSTAEMYRNNYYTTANIGIPYMNDKIVNQMYQWNLAQLLSNCNPDAIQPDDTSLDTGGAPVWCVNFRGFKIYADKCKIQNYDYKVYDVSPGSSDVAGNAKAAWEDLNIDLTANHMYLGTSRADAKGRKGNYTTTVLGSGSDGHGNVYDNWYVTAVGIEYSLVARYEGITPLRKIIAYVFNNQVDGLSKDTTQDYSSVAGTALNDSNHNATLSLGGINGAQQTAGSYDSTGVITTGKLIYTLDR